MLEELKKCLRNEQKDKNIIDIVLYGSLAKGKEKPNDIDIAVIFKSGNLKERLNKIQLMKQKLKAKEKIDIKGILIDELFDESFFGRSGVFLEGISLFSGKPFSERIDFNPSVLFIYNLINKSHAEKVRFNYILSGRNSDGIIKRLNGEHLAAGVVKVPTNNSLEFEGLLQNHNIQHSKLDILIKK